MAKWYGAIGYAERVEVEPGVWVDKITERNYAGDVVRNFSKTQSSGNVNDNIVLTNDVSIVADPYAIKNFYFIRYIEYMGAKWKIEKVELQYPRLLLTTGGLYNEI